MGRRTDKNRPAAVTSSATDASQPPQEQLGAARRFRLILAAMCLLSLACRLIVLSVYVNTNPLAQVPLNDAAVYWDWAERISTGGLIQDAPFFSAPLYPYVLGAIRAVGGGLTTVYVLQLLSDLATAWLLASVCRRRFSARVGLVAAAILLLMQEPASSSLRILASSLHLLLVTVTWASFVRLQTRATTLSHLLAGGAVGLLCLAYAPALLLLGLVPLWLLLSRRREPHTLWKAALPTATALIVIAPATLHNLHASGELFPVQAVGGITLRLGNHPGAEGVYAPLPEISTRRDLMHADAARVYEQKTGRHATWKAVDRYFRDQAVQYWRDNPATFLWLVSRKLYGFVSSRHYGDIYQPTIEMMLGFNRWLRLMPLTTPLVVAPALVGMLILLCRPLRYGPEWLLLFVPVFVTAFFWYSPRFRTPAIPILVVAAAWVLMRAWQWRSYPRTTVAVVLALLVGFTLGSVNRLCGFDVRVPSGVLFGQTYAYQQLGDRQSAIKTCRAGLEYEPGDTPHRIELGNMLKAEGRTAEALVEYQRAIGADPDNRGLIGRVAQMLILARQFDQAAAVLEPAVARHADDYKLLAMFAETQQARGKPARAAELFARAVALAPDDLALRAAYARLLLLTQQFEAARDQYDHILRIAPRDADALYYLGTIASKLGDYAAARDYFVRARVERPRDVATLHNLGVMHYRLAELPEAAEALRAALALDATRTESAMLLQQVEARLNQP